MPPPPLARPLSPTARALCLKEWPRLDPPAVTIRRRDHQHPNASFTPTRQTPFSTHTHNVRERGRRAARDKAPSLLPKHTDTMHPSARAMRPPGLATGGAPCASVPARSRRIGRGPQRAVVVTVAAGEGAIASSAPRRHQQLSAASAPTSSTPSTPTTTSPRLNHRSAASTRRGSSVVARGGAPPSSSTSSTNRLSPFTALPADHHTSSSDFDTIESALEDVRAGKFVVVLDDEDRENEGDLICAADRVTTEAMAFMVEHTSGVICVGMRGEDCDRLELPLMVASRENNECMYTAFTVTADLAAGTTTGISAADRAATLRALAAPSTPAAAFKRPGHIFPLRARPGGVVVRPGHTEAAVDLARLAGCQPAGALCEVVDRRDGSMARTDRLVAFSREHGLKCITIADLIRYRLRTEPEVLVVPAVGAGMATSSEEEEDLVGGEEVEEDPVEAARRRAEGGVDGARMGEEERRRERRRERQRAAAAAAGGVPIDTRHGRFYAHAFRSAVDPSVEHVALVAAAAAAADGKQQQQHDQQPPPPPLACLQLQSGVVDALGSQHCGAEAGLDAALRAVASAGPGGGVVLYVRSAADGAPRGLAAELAAHARREARGCDVNGGADDAARPRDLRDFAAAAGMLRRLGVRSVRVLADEEGLEDAAARWRAAGVDVVAAEGLQRRAGGGNGGNGNGSGAANGHAQLNGSAHAAGVLTAV